MTPEQLADAIEKEAVAIAEKNHLSGEDTALLVAAELRKHLIRALTDSDYRQTLVARFTR